MSDRCTGTDCPGCAHARRHYRAHGCLVPNCTDPHALANASATEGEADAD